MLYDVSCLKKKNKKQKQNNTTSSTLVKPKRRKKKKEKRKGIVKRTFMPSSQKSKSQIWAILSKLVLPIFSPYLGWFCFGGVGKKTCEFHQNLSQFLSSCQPNN